VDTAAVTAGRTTLFPGMAVMARWCGPDGGDDRADGVIPRHGGGGGQGGSSVVPVTAVKVEEERDASVLMHGGEGQADGGDGVDPMVVAAALRRAVSKRAQEILVVWWCPSQNPPVRV
jgi:hypothetical protein